MRERSHEIGRKQLLGVVRLLVRQDSRKVKVFEIGNAYKTAMRTLFTARYQPNGQVGFDGVLGFHPQSVPVVSCLIESKAGSSKSTVDKLPGYFEEFVVRSYCVQLAWRDRVAKHRPLFLFAASSAFESPLLKNGRLIESVTSAAIRNVLRKNIESKALNKVCCFTRVLVYDDWLETLTG